jgi:uncharacterized protein (TIGR03437 family)
MPNTLSFWPLLHAAGLSLLMGVTAPAQSTPPYSITSLPTGKQPKGIDITTAAATGDISAFPSAAYVVIANSGDNSVSVFGFATLRPPFVLKPLSPITGIPSPYAVSTCPSGNNFDASVLVTSPADNSVRALTPSYFGIGDVSPPLQTGSQPYSVACTGGLGGADGTGIVSNVGDNSLTVFDVATLKITATIPGVPGARGLHGIAASIVPQAPENIILAWVAGTDANVVTVVDLVHSAVVTQIPMSSPTAIRADQSLIYIASAGTGSITVFDPSTLSQVNNQLASVPNAQDLIFSSLFGDFAISGVDSVWSLDLSKSGNTANVGSVPGAAALAAPYFFSDLGVPACCAMVLATSPSTNSVYLIQPPPAAPAQFILANGASFGATAVAPGSLASAVPVATGASTNFSASTLPLPEMLGGVAVSIGGSLTFDTPSNMWTYSSANSMPAPLLFVGPNQINLQIPSGINLASAVPAQITEPDGSTLLATLNVTGSSPGIFTLSSNGQGQAAVLNQDNSLNGIPQLIPGANAAAPGSVIQIFATGAGATNPALAPGEAAPSSGNPLVYTLVQPTVTIGGINAPVQFSGMAPGYPGVWQINVQVPKTVTPGNAVPLVVKAGGASSNAATVAIN